MKFFGLILWLCIPLYYSSQTLDDFGYFDDIYAIDSKYFGIAISHTRFTNSDAPYPEEHRINGIRGEIEYKKVNFEKFKHSFSYQNKLMIDLFMSLRQLLFDKETAIKMQESRLSNGIIGWLNYSWNINNPKKYSIALGFNINDYFLTSSYKIDSSTNYKAGQINTIEPQGYWLAVGPSINTRFLINKYLIISPSLSYSISYYRVVSMDKAIENNNYPKPHFGQLNVELMSNFGFFTRIDYNWLINRGNLPNNTKRLDLLLGFRFAL